MNNSDNRPNRRNRGNRFCNTSKKKITLLSDSTKCRYVRYVCALYLHRQRYVLSMCAIAGWTIVQHFKMWIINMIERSKSSECLRFFVLLQKWISGCFSLFCFNHPFAIPMGAICMLYCRKADWWRHCGMKSGTISVTQTHSVYEIITCVILIRFFYDINIDYISK